MTCTHRGCTRRAKFYRPSTKIALCRPHMRAHRYALANRGLEERWKKAPKLIRGRWVFPGDDQKGAAA